ncbi:MarR family winged helix-turn-helix transcriptional regulator, partial [Amycolatopsis mediterranei]
MDAITAPSLAQLINRASRALARVGDIALKPLGLRYAQVPVLALLREGAEPTQKDLAEATGIEQPSMAQLLSRMDRDGLIHRAPHPRDARSQTITLAPGTD